MIYFDINKNAYDSIETIHSIGLEVLTNCTEKEFTELLNNKRVWQGDKIVLNPNYEQEQNQRERERLNTLSLTAADVERAIYKVKGLDFDDILELVKDNPNIDSKALKIELKANKFYRGNPYVSAVGNLLGFTEEQLDKFFETGDYEELM